MLLIIRMIHVPPQEAYTWIKICRRTLNSKIKFTNRALTVLFLRKCQRRKIGTADVKNYTCNIKPNYLRERQRRSLMNNKLMDARYQEDKIRRKFLADYNYLSRRWGLNFPQFMTQFNNLMQSEIEEVWLTGKARVTRRLDFLSQLWFFVHNHVPDKIQEIAISDRMLEEKFGPIEDDDPLIFGRIQLTENESEVMKMDPKYAVHARLDKEDNQVAVQSILAKARWELMNREQRDGDPWSEDWQHQQTRAKTVFDEESSTLSFDKRRHSDHKTVRRVDVPEPQEEVINGHPVEVIFANINAGITNVLMNM